MQSLLARREARSRELRQRREDALHKARLAARMLKDSHRCRRVYLFGSLSGDHIFDEHSDLDLAVEGLDPKVNFWRVYAEVMELVHPHNVDLVIMESANAELRQAILKEGRKL